MVNALQVGEYTMDIARHDLAIIEHLSSDRAIVYIVPGVSDILKPHFRLRRCRRKDSKEKECWYISVLSKYSGVSITSMLDRAVFKRASDSDASPALPAPLPEVAPALPEVAPALPEVAPALPEIALASPEVALASPEVAPALPEIAPALPEIAPALPAPLTEVAKIPINQRIPPTTLSAMIDVNKVDGTASESIPCSHTSEPSDSQPSLSSQTSSIGEQSDTDTSEILGSPVSTSSLSSVTATSLHSPSFDLHGSHPTPIVLPGDRNIQTDVLGVIISPRTMTRQFSLLRHDMRIVLSRLRSIQKRLLDSHDNERLCCRSLNRSESGTINNTSSPLHPFPGDTEGNNSNNSVFPPKGEESESAAGISLSREESAAGISLAGEESAADISLSGEESAADISLSGEESAADISLSREESAAGISQAGEESKEKAVQNAKVMEDITESSLEDDELILAREAQLRHKPSPPKRNREPNIISSASSNLSLLESDSSTMSRRQPSVLRSQRKQCIVKRLKTSRVPCTQHKDAVWVTDVIAFFRNGNDYSSSGNCYESDESHSETPSPDSPYFSPQ